jgi:dextranase
LITNVRKMYSLLITMSLMAASCSSTSETPGTPSDTVLQPKDTLKGDLTLDLSTDKAVYAPGETVTFTATGTLPQGTRIRYRHGTTVIGEQTLSAGQWTWTPPQDDATGYLADVYTEDANGTQTIHGTVAVDVSSDWSAYPRYGFVGTYDDTKTDDVVSSELYFLNRCHINGLQFYDWQNKHHEPVVLVNGKVEDSYADIANRKINSHVVRQYISGAHQYGMKAMFYDLCYGALNDAEQDGVSPRWYMYKDASHATVDELTLPSGWKSDIMLVNPGNAQWQSYFSDRVNEVYQQFDFDGFHIDQVGSRDTEYDYYGSKINVTDGFASFIRKMKQSQPNKRLIMNAVSNYGASSIGGTGDVDFSYTELWGGEDKFSDLYTIMKTNQSYFKAPSGSRPVGQVYAAYMDYNKESGTFNTPGVLLTDAVMFGLGADHLELGDHMLHKEYFPNGNLQMDASLKSAIVRYYDFFTSYENYLRDGGFVIDEAPVSGSSDVTLAAWPPKLNTVTTFSREIGSAHVVNLFNFKNANSLSWRDMDGTQPEPQLLSNISLSVKATNVKKVWAASPDIYGGVPQELQFKQDGGSVIFTVPTLKYWTMIVIE